MRDGQEYITVNASRAGTGRSVEVDAVQVQVLGSDFNEKLPATNNRVNIHLPISAKQVSIYAIVKNKRDSCGTLIDPAKKVKFED